MELNIPIDSQIISSALLDQLIVWLFVIILVIVAVVIILFVLRKIFTSHKLYPAVFEKKIFMLTVPEFDLDKNDENKAKNIKELLMGVENFYSSLGGLIPHKGFKVWLFGRYDSWSFEMVVGLEGLITFYMAIPVYLENYIKQQMLSQFPHCQIEEVEDYNIFNSQGYVAGGYLKLAKPAMFPILTYKQMETDPILGILSTLSKLPPGHTVAIQFVMRSAQPNWRKRGVKVASEMQQGKKLKEAMSSASASGLTKVLGKTSDWLPSPAKNDNKPSELYRLSPMEEQMVKSIEEKASKSGLDVNIRIIVFAPMENHAKDVMRHIANAFSEYSSYQYANAFKAVIKGSSNKLIQDFIYRNFDNTNYCVLNSEEMASLWHLPYPNTEVPRIKWLQAKKLSPPVNMPTEGIVLGEMISEGVSISSASRMRTEEGICILLV